MEDKSFFGLVKDLFKETFSFLKTIAIEGNESDLLQKMEVKKGLVNGLKYLIFLMILPIRVAIYFVNPDLRAYRFVEKAVTPFLFIEAIFGNKNVVAETYAKFVENLRAGATTELKANIEDIDRFKVLFVIKKLLVAFIFSFLIYAAGEVAFDSISSFLGQIGNIGFFGGAGAAAFAESGSALLGMSFVGLILILILKIIAIAFVSYIIYLLLKIIIFSIRDAYVLDVVEMQNFIFDLIDYTHQKTKQIYGKEVPKQALYATIENFVLKINGDWDKLRLDMLSEKRLESEKDFIEIQKKVKEEKEDDNSKI